MNQWAGSIVKRNPNEIVGALSKQVQKEIDHVCSENSETILRRTVLKRILNGRRSGVTLKSLLVGICSGKVNKSMLCMMVTMILKQRFHKLTYVQQNMSIMLHIWKFCSQTSMRGYQFFELMCYVICNCADYKSTSACSLLYCAYVTREH